MINLEPGTEEKIKRAAEKVFLKEGFDGSRMQTIADEAGINKALLHYYFRSKEKLFEQVLLDKVKTFLPEIAAVAHSQIPLLEKVEIIVEHYLRLFLANPQLPLFVIFSVNKNPAFVKELPGEIFQMMVKQIKAALRKSRYPRIDPEHLLVSILSLCIFPFIARPVAAHILQKSDDQYDLFLKNRKKEIMNILNPLLEE